MGAVAGVGVKALFGTWMILGPPTVGAVLTTTGLATADTTVVVAVAVVIAGIAVDVVDRG